MLAVAATSGYAVRVSLSVSADVRVMLHPFVGYRELAEAGRESRTGANEPERSAAEPSASPRLDLLRALGGPLKLLLAISCFVAFSTSGRLTWDHLLFAPLSWAFVPLLQSLWVLLTVRAFGIERRQTDALELFFRGHLPWLLLLMLLAGVCLLAPSAWQVFDWLLSTRVLFVLVLAAQGWTVLLTYAFFRSGLTLSRARAIGAAALFYAGYIGSLLVYFSLAGQLAPILGLLD